MAQLPKISLIGAERRVHFLKAHFFLGALIFFLFFFGRVSFHFVTKRERRVAIDQTRARLADF